MFVSILSEIEKSGTVPIATPPETEQSETDCDVAEALNAAAPADQPAFVSPRERWVRAGVLPRVNGFGAWTLIPLYD